MGAIGGLLGLGGGASGTGFAKPEQAPIVSGVDANQTGQAYGTNQDALLQQQRLVQALQAQGGLGNQSQVYGQNQGLYNQFQGIAAGEGPNPAQAMLSNATGANVAQTGALMAGQRGAGANTGLIARQAAQQGANIQQNAAGQAALMQAQQSLGALGQAQNVLGQAGGIANTQAANQIGATEAYTAAQQAEQGNLLNALAQQNQAKVSSQSSVNAGNAGLAQTGMQGQQGLIGGVLGGIGAAVGLAGGGPVPSLGVDTSMPNVGAQSSFGQFMTKVTTPQPQQQDMFQMGGNQGAQALNKGMTSIGRGIGSAIKGSGTSSVPAAVPAAEGGLVDVVLSPGEKVVAPKDVEQAAGGQVKAKTVPGKAEVEGDSLKNDKVEAKLPPGSIVVPRTKAKKDASGFVRDTLAKRGMAK